MLDKMGRPIGSFGGLADTSSVDPTITHWEAMVNEAASDPRVLLGGSAASDRERAKVRRQAEELIEEYVIFTLDAMYKAGGPPKIMKGMPDGTTITVDNPEHRRRFAEVIPFYFKIMRLNYSRVTITSISQFGDAKPTNAMSDGRPLKPAEYKAFIFETHKQSVPDWALAKNTPFVETISLHSLYFTGRRWNQWESLKGHDSHFRGSRESFLRHIADGTLNDVDHFAQSLGHKLGYVQQAAWMERLKSQSYDKINKLWINPIDVHSGALPKSYLHSEVSKRGNTSTGVESKLAEVKELLSQGLIDQAEHDALRRKILGI
jgi:hypothetical protein